MASDFDFTTAVADQFNADAAAIANSWPDEPPRLRMDDIDSLILWCVAQRASDISIQSDRPVFIEVDGELRTATRRPMDGADVNVVLEKLYGAEAMAQLAGGRDLDLSYEIRPDRFTCHRFRVNITAILSRGRDAVQVTMRVLPSLPPTLAELNIEKEIVDAWAPRQGMILITGPTGSGKSTLLAAGNRLLIERPEGCGKLLTYEAPIEYVYDAIASERSLVAQTEIPRHLPTFAAGVRNALRRKPNVILVGEVRDRETVMAAIEAGQTGHAVYATVHTTGVAATIRRMMSMFDSGERIERGYALMETMRLIVTQALVPRVGGGRIGIREWMIFNDDVRETLLHMHEDQWSSELIKMVPKNGRSMAQSAQIAFDAGLIDQRNLILLSKSTGHA
ncbi:MAG TPA: ATPase, T2SS/T4P/T4SS family [Alphaproteobacteria bacterium]|nr:ATPase, T2SS/T4P/T4SS family [Alphaproteobacteria bacterium]